MDTLEKFIQFVAAYPLWAKLTMALSLSVFLVVAMAAYTKPAYAKPAAKPDPTPDGPVVIDAALTDQKPLWLHIEGVHLFGSLTTMAVRVTATVNGTAFVYPSQPGVSWLEVGPAMAHQAFRLPSTNAGYDIRFSMDGKRPHSSKILNFANLDAVHVGTIPLRSKSYNLHSIDNQVKEDNVGADVVFSVTDSPND